MNKKGFVGIELLIGLIVLSIIIAGVVVVNNARLNQDLTATPTPTQIENNDSEISPTPESTLAPSITPEPTNSPTPQPKADPPLAETTKPTNIPTQTTATPTTPSATSQPPTSTPIALSSTPTITSVTSTLTPTHTPTPTSTNTPQPTTNPTATNTPVPTPTDTPIPTPVPSPTPTPIPTTTSTPTPTSTTTPTPVCIPTLCPVRPNAIQVCLTGGVCGFTCNAYYGDCDSAAANGCELNIGNNVNNCGSCGHVCTLPHATNGCSQGSCFIQFCDSGWADCNNNPNDGCECYPN